MPTIDNGGNQHTEMGSGALVPTSLLPAIVRLGYGPPSQAGPQGILLRLRPGTDRVAAVRTLRRFAQQTSTQFDDGVSVNGVQRPAEIVNYRSMGSTPAILGAALAAGAVTALGLTLVASVRRRRRELAIFKTLGFTQRQLAATVAWQSTVAVLIGTLVGVPVGIIVGRQLWLLFAHEIDVIPTPTVPTLTVALIAVGALVLANLVAALPGRIAARTPTALLLRSE
jgi:ABC-type antimicrobial peptide transport system permease subunit